MNNINKMFLNQSNMNDDFSEYAEKDYIINSQTKNKHLLEKTNSLKEKGQLIDQMKQKLDNISSSNSTNSTYNNSETSNNVAYQPLDYNINTKNFLSPDNIPTDQTIFLQDPNINQTQMTSSLYMSLYSSNLNNMTTANYAINNNNNTKILPKYGVINRGTQNIPMPQIYTIPINQNYSNIQNMALNNNNTYSNYGASQYSLNTMLKNSKSIKSEIIENHAIRLTDYYDYLPNETDKKINELLEEINYFGEITEKEIREEKKLNTSNYISVHEALEIGKNSIKNGYKNDFYVLALLAKSLSTQGCIVLIERNAPIDNEGKKEIFTTIQFLASGMYNFHKYIFYFNFGQQIDEILCNNVNERNNFNIILKNKLLLLFNLKENDILLTNPTFFPYTITAIIKKSQYNEYSPEILLKSLNTEFNTLVDIKKKILLSGCKLNKHMLDYRGNNNDRGWGQNEMRGGAPYYPPKGWVGYGLRIADRYDKGNNAWIDYNNSKGEWNVAYHGIGSVSRINQILGNNNTILVGIKNNFKDFNDLFHYGQKVGEGIIVTPKPQVMERHCAIIDCYGIKYKIGFMTRVMPLKKRCAQGQDDYWIINGTDNEIRPYRILIKEL